MLLQPCSEIIGTVSVQCHLVVSRYEKQLFLFITSECLAILGVDHFEFCQKILYFMNALAYRYETWFVSFAPCMPSKIIIKFQ